MEEAAKPLSLNMAAALIRITSLFEDFRRNGWAIPKDKES
jgi:hypothetical protein